MQDSATPASSTNEQKVALCEQRIGYKFRNFAIAVSALTHASGAVNRLQSNERLEFLGDAILGLPFVNGSIRNTPNTWKAS